MVDFFRTQEACGSHLFSTGSKVFLPTGLKFHQSNELKSVQFCNIYFLFEATDWVNLMLLSEYVPFDSPNKMLCWPLAGQLNSVISEYMGNRFLITLCVHCLSRALKNTPANLGQPSLFTITSKSLFKADLPYAIRRISVEQCCIILSFSDSVVALKSFDQSLSLYTQIPSFRGKENNVYPPVQIVH